MGILLRLYYHFSYAGIWVNFTYHICYENIGRKHNKILLEVKIQTDHRQTELSNMLVKKNILNEINKE